MLTSPHVIVGAAIASGIPNPIIALPLSFASHFVLDILPHWNPHLNTELKKYGHITVFSRNLIYADTVFAIASLLVLSFSNPNPIIIMLGGFLGTLPDLVEAPYFFLGWKTKFVMWWLRFQKAIQCDVSPLPGIVSQILVVIASLWWMFT